MAPRLWPLVAAAAVLSRGVAGAELVDADTVRVDPETGLLRDAIGRVRILHGVNVVSKEWPWYPTLDTFSTTDSLDPQTMDLLRTWGFNVVRLGVMWPGVEPEKGQIDQNYIDIMKNITIDLAERGIYTLVDMHQDLGSRRFCGEGLPEFYVDELAAKSNSDFAKAKRFPLPFPYDMSLNSSGYPPLDKCLAHPFQTFYLTEKVGTLWNEVYRPGSDLYQGFLAYWATVAAAFEGLPQVCGYELLNEPPAYCLEPDTWMSCLNPSDLIEVVSNDDFERQKLVPLYKAAAQAIRAVDATTPIFYEPPVVPKIFVGVFSAPVLDDDPQQGLAYHVYCAPSDKENFLTNLVCEATQDTYLKLYHAFWGKHKRVAGFLTEFGAVVGDTQELDNLARLMSRADDKFHSWAYWMLKRYNDFTTIMPEQGLWDKQGNLNTAKVKALSRTYAQAIAGTPSKMSYDASSGAFSLTFVAAIETAPTVVYLNEALNYPKGYQVQVSPADCLLQTQPEPNYLEFMLKAGASCKGGTVSISIKSLSSGCLGSRGLFGLHVVLLLAAVGLSLAA